MANLYVASTGSNTAPYDTWSNAATAPLTAITAAAAGDTIYQHAETFTISADTTYTLAAGVRWICTNDKANEPPQALSTSGEIVSTTSNVDVTISGTGYVYGLKFKLGGSSYTTLFVTGAYIICESCTFEIANTNTGSVIHFGQQATSHSDSKFISCTAKFAATAPHISLGGRLVLAGGVYSDASGPTPTTLFKSVQYCRHVLMTGVDLSNMTSGTIVTQASAYLTRFVLVQCKLGAATLNGSISGANGSEYFVYDCSSADEHYKFAHYNYFGSTTVSTSIYADDGAEYNSAGNVHSWVVAGNANTLLATPYISPWIPLYHDASSAIPPELGILRDGSYSAFTHIEVWSAWMVKTSGGSPLAAI